MPAGYPAPSWSPARCFWLERFSHCSNPVKADSSPAGSKSFPISARGWRPYLVATEPYLTNTALFWAQKAACQESLPLSP